MKTILIILIMIAGLFFFLFIEIPSADKDTSGWKVYRNEEYGFEFQYPGSTEFIENQENAEFGIQGFGVKVAANSENHANWKRFVLVRGKLFSLYEPDDGMPPVKEELILRSGDKSYEIFPMATYDPKVDRSVLSTFKLTK